MYQRDISHNVPRDHLASHYLDIMDEILPLTPNDRLFYGAKHGYDEIVKSALQQTLGPPSGWDQDSKYVRIFMLNDDALRLAAENGHTETVKLLLDHGARYSC